MSKSITLFHIWSGKPMPENYRQNIIANHAILREGDRHILISEETIECCEHVSFADVKRQIMHDDEFNRLFVDRTVMNDTFKWNSTEVALADFIRFYYALKNRPCAYADCDYKMLAPISELDEEYMWVAPNGKSPDIFFFYDSGMSGVVEGILGTLRNGPVMQVVPVGGMAVMYLSTIGKDKVKMLPADSFTHSKN